MHMQGGSGECPGCTKDHGLNVDIIQSPPEVVTKIIGGLYIWWEGPACQQYMYVQLQELSDHVASGCQQHTQLQPDPTVAQLLSQSPHTPTTARIAHKPWDLPTTLRPPRGRMPQA